MATPNPEKQPPLFRLRAAFLEALRCFDETEAIKSREKSVLELLVLVRTYARVPADIVKFAETLEHSTNGPENSDQRQASIWASINTWLAKIQASRPEDSRPILPKDGKSQTTAPVTTSAAKTLSWEELVASLRTSLIASNGAGRFEKWRIPQLKWTSQWCEAYAVISRADNSDQTGWVIIPNELAATSREAQEWWSLKTRAASLLRQNAANNLRWEKVIGHEDETETGFVILERSNLARPLSEQIGHRALSDGRTCVALAIELCNILQVLNDAGVHVLDLPLESVHFAWSAGLRITQLSDPTAVIPTSKLLPEWRFLDSPSPASSSGAHDSSQVFLIAAILLTCLRGNAEVLQGEKLSHGRSASLAMLAGYPNMVDSDTDRITEPLVTQLENRPGCRTIDVRRVVSILQWALSERPNERSPDVREFAKELSQILS